MSRQFWIHALLTIAGCAVTAFTPAVLQFASHHTALSAAILAAWGVIGAALDPKPDSSKAGYLSSVKALILVSLLAIGVSSGRAQSPTPTPIPQGTINFSANFSSFGAVASVNGSSNVTASIFTAWAPITGNSGKLGNIAARLDTVQMPGQSAQIWLAGLEKSWQGGKLLPLKNLTFDPNKYWLAAFAEAGGKKQDTVALPAFSARIGAALRRKLTDNLGLNLFEVSYLRTDIGKPTSTKSFLFSGPNNWTAGAGLTVSFGR